MGEYLISALIAWVVAFIANKAINKSKDHGQKSWLSSGGMPSKHTALVTAVAATALFVEGFDSPEFAISITMASVVMYDAVNVRRAVGQNRAAILALYDNIKSAKSLHDEDPLRGFKSLGHKPAEVLVGALIGILVAAIVSSFLL